MPKICQILNWATEKLQKAGIESAGLDAEILILSAVAATVKPAAMADKLNKSFLYTHPEFELTKTQVAKYKKFINRRSKNEPVAYILGHKEFFGLDFLVNKNVLIPRPETEMIVEECLTRLRPSNPKGLATQLDYGGQASVLLIDIGTGSGCIPISILNQLQVTGYLPRRQAGKLQVTTLAADLSEKALAVAKKNARLHGVSKKIKFVKSDLLSFCHPNRWFQSPDWNHNVHLRSSRETGANCKNIIITANLPYLPDKIYKENYTNLKFEPRLALVARNNGLFLYEKFLKQIANYPPLSKGRRGGVVTENNNHPASLTFGTPPSKGGDKTQTTLLFEILPFQKPFLEKIIKKHLPKASVEFKKDLAGKWRAAIIKI